MRISDWSSDVCSSDLLFTAPRLGAAGVDGCDQARGDLVGGAQAVDRYEQVALLVPLDQRRRLTLVEVEALADRFGGVVGSLHDLAAAVVAHPAVRSEEHTSELPSLMRISFAVFCLQKKNK